MDIQTQQKKPTPAWLKADQARDQFNACEGGRKLVADDYSCVVYLSSTGSKFLAKGYKGRAQKHHFYYSFGSEEARAEYVDDFMTRMKSRKQSSARSERNLKVDDVLYCSWGYDQTNIDFYLVTRLVGKSSVEIVEIGSLVERDRSDCGTCVPDTQNIIGKPMKKRANGCRVRINSFSSASLLKPVTEVAGVKMYKPLDWSSWH